MVRSRPSTGPWQRMLMKIISIERKENNMPSLESIFEAIKQKGRVIKGDKIRNLKHSFLYRFFRKKLKGDLGDYSRRSWVTTVQRKQSLRKYRRELLLGRQFTKRIDVEECVKILHKFVRFMYRLSTTLFWHRQAASLPCADQPGAMRSLFDDE